MISKIDIWLNNYIVQELPFYLLQTCDELNVKPEQCIIIGDRVETDIEGGKKANLAATIWIRFDPSYQRLPDENNCPDFIVDNVMGLKQILSQLNCSQNDKTRWQCFRSPTIHRSPISLVVLVSCTFKFRVKFCDARMTYFIRLSSLFLKSHRI